MFQFLHRWHLRVEVAVLAMFLVGCGGGERPTAPVEGTVWIDGEQLMTGSVTFVPVEPGPTASGEIGSDGFYRLTTYQEGDGAVLGKHGVMVVAIDYGEVSGLPEDPTEPKLLVPEEYGNPKTSGLSFEVSDVELNLFDIQLFGKDEAKSDG